ncbi:MAG: VOC family protein [Acidimicrobiia bacterium]|nr:VOC family protein [Acidimicrobiia bacterium]
MNAIARFSLVAIDCPDPAALAAFYARITGWTVGPVEGDWVELRSDSGPTIAFQHVTDYTPPEWPGSQHPQQMHLDFDVLDLDEGERQVLALGARKTESQPGETWRVFLDPADHPFCLVLDPSMRS